MNNFNNEQDVLTQCNHNVIQPEKKKRFPKLIIVLLIITNIITIALAYRNGSIANANYNYSLELEQDLQTICNEFDTYLALIDEYGPADLEYVDAAQRLEVICLSYSLYDDFACFLSASGEKTYHRLNCKAVDDFNRFWIYDIRAAKSIGYTPCPYCEPPEPTSFWQLFKLLFGKKNINRVFDFKLVNHYIDLVANENASFHFFIECLWGNTNHFGNFGLRIAPFCDNSFKFICVYQFITSVT